MEEQLCRLFQFLECRRVCSWIGFSHDSHGAIDAIFLEGVHGSRMFEDLGELSNVRTRFNLLLTTSETN